MPKLRVDGKEIAEIDQATTDILLEAAAVGVGRGRQAAPLETRASEHRTKPICQITIDLDFFL